MSATQLSFSLRVSSGVKSVHLLGSWDNYSGQLPLSKDKSSSKSGSWKGTFRFNGSLKSGQRYWYYYIIDGYHVAHNPSVDSTVEPTTGRALNILDMPKGSSSKSSSSSGRSSSSSSSKKSSSSRRSSSNDIPKGRPLSTSQIKAPKPVSPNATRTILDYDEEVDELTSRFSGIDVDSESEDDSDLSYRSSPSSSSPSSSVSGYSTPASDCSACSCERYGITRKGERVRLDCGGSRCGDSDSSCSDSEEEYVANSSRRNGVVMRG